MARLQTTSCDADGQWSGSGTGFLVADDLLVTAAHVVKDASTITAVVDGHLTGVEVLGSNNVADVALLRMTRASKGHIFSFAAEDPPVGTAVAALGFPHQQELSFSQGTVSGLNREFVRAGARQSHLIQTDTPTNPGNSGGPMITIDGSVAGIIVSKFDDTETRSIEGLGFAVSATRAAAAVKEWEERAVPIDLKPCTGDESESVEFATRITSEHDQAENIAQTLQAHGQGINDGAYAAAFNLFTPQFQQRAGGLETWSSGLATTVWLDLDVKDVAGHGNDVKATVQMVSQQAADDAPEAPGAPQTCSVWNIEYSMHWDGIQWLIGGNRRIGGPPVACEFGD
ncbi:S1C family serine protease [Arthrobacter sp. JSM 101049]|uniref:S1C family serine protease n=1 Tax=Arthrobacter sp. JSM 101049 TaxID=929097 RepID=UPI003568F8DA